MHEYFGVSLSSAGIVSMLISGGTIISGLAPPLFGVLSSVVGMWLIPAYITLFMAMMILMVERTFGKTAVRG